MPFDVAGARQAGYSDGEIASYLATQSGFDLDAATKAGYRSEEVVSFLSTSPAKPAKLEPEPQAPQGDPMGSGFAEMTSQPAPAERNAGGGRGFVNPDAAVARPSMVANAGGSVIAGVREMGKAAGIATLAPAKAIDFVSSLITGKEQTDAQDLAGKAFIDPNQTAIEHWAPTEEDQPRIVDKVVNGLARMAPTFAAAIATGGGAAAPEAAMGMEAVRQAVLQGMRSMSVPAFSAGIEKAAGLLEQGADLKEAVTAGLTEGMTSDVTGGLAMSAPGANIAKRLAQGAAVGATTGDVSRQAQNIAAPNFQTERTPEGVAVSALTGAVLAGSMRHPNSPVHADRIDLGYDPTTGKTATAEAVQGMGGGMPRFEPGRAEPLKATPADILKAATVDDAIAKAQEVVNAGPKLDDELLAIRPLVQPTVDFSKAAADARALTEQKAADVSQPSELQPVVARADGAGRDVAPVGVDAGVGIDRVAGPAVDAGGTRVEPAREPISLDAGQPASLEPKATWFGRRGDGYVTEGDAMMALPSRQKIEPDLSWKIEAMPNGKFRLAGYDGEVGKSGDATQSDTSKIATGAASIRPDGRTDAASVGDYGLPVPHVADGSDAGRAGGESTERSQSDGTRSQDLRPDSGTAASDGATTARTAVEPTKTPPLSGVSDGAARSAFENLSKAQRAAGKEFADATPAMHRGEADRITKATEGMGQFYPEIKSRYEALAESHRATADRKESEQTSARAETILDAAGIKGAERIAALKDVKTGAITVDELARAHPAPVGKTGEGSDSAMAAMADKRAEVPAYSRENKPTVEVDGKQYPAENSNGQPIHPTEEGQRNFWRRFKDSKVVDDTGAPQVVYHGTGKTFNKFSFKDAGQKIIWFTSDRSSIERGEVGAAGNGKVMEMYADLKNPASWDQYEKLGLSELEARGYDGAILKNADGSFDGFAFKSSQLKSATKNNGQFDANNPDIRFRRGQEAPAGIGKEATTAALSDTLPKLTVPYTIHATAQAARNATGVEIPQGAKGMHYKDEIHLFADSIHSDLEAQEVLWHEAQHAGLDRVYGKGSKDYEAALRDIALKNNNIREASKAWMDQHGEADYAARIANGMKPEQAMLRTKLQAVDEALAEMSGANIKINGAAKFVAKVIEVMRSVGLDKLADKLETLTDAQALSMILRSREAVTGGGQKEMVGDMQPAFSGKDDSSFSRAKVADEAPPKEEVKTPGFAAHVGASLMANGLVRDAFMHTAPMSLGTKESRAAGQKFANDMRAARFQWTRLSEMVKAKFSKDEREAMWNAADEQNTLMQEGKDTTGKGLDRLNEKQRAAMETLHGYADELWKRAQDVGLVSGEGLPFWTPRMAVMIGEDGSFAKPGGEGKKTTSDGVGRNVTTSAPSAMHRKHLTTEESEAALKAKKGDNAEYVRDILTMPMAMSRFEQAIAGRELINTIKEIGLAAGKDTVSTTGGPEFFTLDHPAFMSFKPRMIQGAEGKTVAAKDQNGVTIMDKTPLFISKDFEGPLKAVMSGKDGDIYSGYMLLKGKAMTAIMSSPLTHNMVIYGRAVAYSPIKVGSGYLYWKGHMLSKDNALMNKFIRAGMVPIGANKNSMMDVTDVARGLGKQGSWGDPNESWVSLSAQKLGNGIKDGLGDKAKEGLDAAGDFLHHTLLWKQVGAIQVGIANDARQHLMAKGFSDDAATQLAAHLSNRYAGAVAQENMSEMARKVANAVLFSRSFNMGNLGTIKDMFSGLPEGMKAKLMSDVGEMEGKKALDYAKRKARATVVADVAIALLATSVVQSAVNVMKHDKTLDEEAKGYLTRLSDMFENWKDKPLDPSSYNVYRASPTWENEPDKHERIDMGEQPGGRHEYMRLPTGKVVEDMIGWVFHPGETFAKKMSPAAKAMWQVAANDKGFGVPVKDPEGGFYKQAYDVAAHLATSQVPWDTIKNAYDLSKGKATELDKDKLKGFATGFTFSQGHPQGPEGAVASKVEERVQASKKYLMEQVKRDLKYGDEDAARDKLEEIGLTQKEINLIIKRVEDPKSGLSKSARQRFNRHATEEDQQLMDRQR